MNVQCTVFCCQLDNFLIDAAASYGKYANSDISSVRKRIQILFARSISSFEIFECDALCFCCEIDNS
jgi:hypothetical protein